MMGYFQNCPYPPVDPAHPEVDRCEWRYWVADDAYGPAASRTARRELGEHIRTKHTGRNPMGHVSETGSVTPIKPFADSINSAQMHIVLQALSAYAGQMNVADVLEDKHDVFGMMARFHGLMKHGGRLDVVPF